jgi:hypothetical protein
MVGWRSAVGEQFMAEILVLAYDPAVVSRGATTTATAG